MEILYDPKAGKATLVSPQKEGPAAAFLLGTGMMRFVLERDIPVTVEIVDGGTVVLQSESSRFFDLLMDSVKEQTEVEIDFFVHYPAKQYAPPAPQVVNRWKRQRAKSPKS